MWKPDVDKNNGEGIDFLSQKFAKEKKTVLKGRDGTE
jgi:hypothetical protein